MGCFRLSLPSWCSCTEQLDKEAARGCSCAKIDLDTLKDKHLGLDCSKKAVSFVYAPDGNSGSE